MAYNWWKALNASISKSPSGWSSNARYKSNIAKRVEENSNVKKKAKAKNNLIGIRQTSTKFRINVSKKAGGVSTSKSKKSKVTKKSSKTSSKSKKSKVTKKTKTTKKKTTKKSSKTKATSKKKENTKKKSATKTQVTKTTPKETSNNTTSNVYNITNVYNYGITEEKAPVVYNVNLWDTYKSYIQWTYNI